MTRCARASVATIRSDMVSEDSGDAFLDNHLKDLVALDFFVVPTATLGVIVLDEVHLRQILERYFAYHNATRCHLSLAGDAPQPRGIQGPELGRVIEFPEVGGLHHRYERAAA